MKNKNDKFLFLGLFPSCLIVAIVFSLIATFAVMGPQPLNQEKIDHYADVAENIWNKKTTTRSTSLQIRIEEDSITVSSYNFFEETVTVFFNESTPKVIVNQPGVHFTGCAVFFYTLTAVSLFGSIMFLMATINEFRQKKDTTPTKL